MREDETCRGWRLGASRVLSFEWARLPVVELTETGERTSGTWFGVLTKLTLCSTRPALDTGDEEGMI